MKGCPPKATRVSQLCWVGALCFLVVTPSRGNPHAADPVAVDTWAPASGQDSLDQYIRGTLVRALLIPGWGQLRNGQAYKIPFVYGLLGGAVYSMVYQHAAFVEYDEAYLWRAYEDLQLAGRIEANPYETLAPSYSEVASRLGPISSSSLRNLRNKTRRNRDFSALGIGLVYSISVLDAFVHAHLADFEMADRMNITVIPSRSFVAARLEIRF